MDVTGFFNDIIIGLATFARNVLVTAYEFVVSPDAFAAAVVSPDVLAPGTVPPVAYLVVSVMLLSLTTLGTLMYGAPEVRKWRIITYFSQAVTAFEWKRLLILAIPFLAFITLQAVVISLAANLFGYAVPLRFAVRAMFYGGGTGYLIMSVLLLLALPQWARDEDKRFQPRWLWLPPLIALLFAGVTMNTYAFVTVLATGTGGSFWTAYALMMLGVFAGAAAIVLAAVWASPLFAHLLQNGDGEEGH